MVLRSKIRPISYLRDLYVLRHQQPISQNYFPRSRSETGHNMSGRVFWSYLQSLVTVLWIQVCHRCAGSNCIRILTCLQKPHFVLPFQEILLPAAEILTVAAPWSSPPVTASSYRALAASTRAMLFGHLKKLDSEKPTRPNCPAPNLLRQSKFGSFPYSGHSGFASP